MECIYYADIESGKVTSVGWQVTLCKPVQVTSGSSDMKYQEELYTPLAINHKQTISASNGNLVASHFTSELQGVTRRTGLHSVTSHPTEVTA